MSQSDPEAPQDPAVAAEVARAIRPYRAVVPASAAAEVQARLAALEKHPVAATILAQLREAADDRGRRGG